MWIWFAWEVLLGWAIPSAFIIVVTDWPLAVKIGAVVLLFPVAVIVVRLLTRWVGE